jgi:membrane protease YdiL (CAAX protease family)
MHFFSRDKKRMLVATLSGSFFGLIHMDSYGLVLATFGLGTILAWVFMEDRYRNLSALGFIHGFLGSTFGKLFKGEAAGVLRIDFRVGPGMWSSLLPRYSSSR